MSQRTHNHHVNLQEDIFNDFPWDSVIEGDDSIKGITRSLLSLFRIREDNHSGYLIPLGSIKRMDCARAEEVYNLSNIDTKIPADLYKWLNLVQEFLDICGYESDLSTIIRFACWFRYPNTIVPNGDLLTGESGWYPHVVHVFDFMRDCFKDDSECVRFDEFHSHFVEPQGMKHCDRVQTSKLVEKFNRQSLTEFLSMKGWTSSLEIHHVRTFNGDILYCVHLKVLKEGKVVDTEVQSDEINNN